jgi:hypothetical protein
MSSRRSLITDILTVQFVITGAITVIALAGLTWTSGAVIKNNLAYWAEQWADELNELGAPFYLQNRDGAVLDVERFVEKYPEILSVTWYRPDGSVFTSIPAHPLCRRRPLPSFRRRPAAVLRTC